MYRLRRHPVITAVFSFIIAIIACRALSGVFANAGTAESFLLAEGTRHRGDLAVVARIVDLREDAVVEGDVSIVALESVRIGSRILGDLTILASGVDIYVLPGMQVSGDVSICARSINGLRRAAVAGEVNTGCDELDAALRRYGAGSVSFGLPGFDLNIFLPFFRGYDSLWQVLLNTAVIAIVAGVFAAVLPMQYQRIVTATVKVSVPAGIIGLLTMGAMVVVTVIYAVVGIFTLGLLLCLGFPIMSVLWLVVNVALIVGWVGASFPVGAWLMGRLRMDYSRVKAAALGAAALTLGQGLLSLLPCIGVVAWLGLVIIGSVGLGAVLLTRAGFRAYPEMIQVNLDA